MSPSHVLLEKNNSLISHFAHQSSCSHLRGPQWSSMGDNILMVEKSEEHKVIRDGERRTRKVYSKYILVGISGFASIGFVLLFPSVGNGSDENVC